MTCKKAGAISGLGGLALLLMVGVAGAQQPQAQPRVVDQLLDIMRQNKLITKEQYRDLKQRAEEERQEDLRKAGAAPPAATVVPVAAEQQPTPPAVAAAPPAPSSASPDTMRAYFKNGVNFETADKNFTLNIGGRLNFDGAINAISKPVKKEFDLAGTYSGAEIRRARISLAGVVHRDIDYKIEYDFATGYAVPKDVFIGMRNLPAVQYFRVGHFKEPYSLETITSDNFTTFMERGLPFAFSPDYQTGMALMPTFFDERVTLAVGGFRESADANGYGFSNQGMYDVPVRVTGLPLYENKGRDLVHVGLSFMYRFRADDEVLFAQRPEAHLYPVALVNTGPILTDGVTQVNPELAWVHGPLSLQAEYMRVFVNQVYQPSPQFDGLYAFASYFLTEGDHREYRLAHAAFERVYPQRNFQLHGPGWGAWELAVRYSRLNLTSETVQGGREDDITGAVNWYLNPVIMVRFNYVWAHLEGVGDSSIFESRFQLAF